MSVYRVFELFVFIGYKSVSSIFPGLYCLKTKLKKGPFLDQNHGLKRLEKCQFLPFWTSCFYRLQRRFFDVEYRKRDFPGLYCPKKKFAKRAIFGPKPWVNRFEKMPIFRLFKLFVFIGFKEVFSMYSIVKDIFLAYFE